MNLFWLEHQIGIVVFLAVLVLIALSNLRAIKRLPKKLSAEFLDKETSDRTPRVSVLVPARNEEKNIEAAVSFLLAQDYPNFELVVLDDLSMDNTPVILGKMENPRLRVRKGTDLPPGWIGKNWACHQLAQHAVGEFLLFTDADTRHSSSALSAAVAVMEKEKLDLLSVIPREETKSWAEKLLVPIVPWAIMSFLPLALAYRMRRPAFTAANGQFLMFRRTAYERIGGHAAIKESVVDDLALVRRAARLGLLWRLYDAQNLVACRMYHTSREVFDGFGKNLFGAFGFKIIPFVFVWLWLLLVTFQPLCVLSLAGVGVKVPALSLNLATAAVLLALLLWSISNRKFRFPWYVIPLYPLSIALAAGIAAYSVTQTCTGRAVWKGRWLPRKKPKW